MTNRIWDGCRYVASEDRLDIAEYCERHGISIRWIRYSSVRNKYYLRLWGKYKKDKYAE